MKNCIIGATGWIFDGGVTGGYEIVVWRAVDGGRNKEEIIY